MVPFTTPLKPSDPRQMLSSDTDSLVVFVNVTPSQPDDSNTLKRCCFSICCSGYRP